MSVRPPPRTALLALLALAVLCHASAATAQAPASAASILAPSARAAQAGQRFWMGVGVGAANVGLSAQGDASMLQGHHLYRFRITGHAPAGDVRPAGERSLPMSELSLMYGRGTWLRGGNWLAAAAGLGLASGSGPESRPEQDFAVPGVAVEAQLISRRRPKLALTAIGNLNPEQPFMGLTLGLVLGRAP